MTWETPFEGLHGSLEGGLLGRIVDGLDPRRGISRRFDTMPAFSSWFSPGVFTDTPRYGRRTDGGTPTDFSGPSDNSQGPYIYLETSGNYALSLLADRSLLTLDMDLFGGGRNRTLGLRMCLNRGTSQPAQETVNDGWHIEMADNEGSWGLVRIVHHWPTNGSDTPQQGDVVASYISGTPLTIVQDGGWADISIDIPDGVTGLRMFSSAGNDNALYRRDAGFWSGRLEWDR